MAQKDVFFGSVTDATKQALSGLIAEFGAARIQYTINNTSPLLASGALEKVEADGAEVTVTPMIGALNSTQWIAPYGTLPLGGAPVPTKGRAGPSNIVSVLRMEPMAVLAKLNNKQLGREFDRALDITANDCKRHLEVGIIGGAVSPVSGGTMLWSGTAADSTVTLRFDDVSMFRMNAAYDFVDTSANKSYVVRAIDVTPATGTGITNSANVGGTVTFINDMVNPATNAVVAITDAGAVTVTTSDVFRLRGTTAGFGGAGTVITGIALNSLSDIAGSADLHGLSASTVLGWKGQTLALNAPYNQEALLGFAQRVLTYGGEYPTHAIMNPQAAVAHQVNATAVGAHFGNSAFAQVASRTATLDKSMDKYGAAKDGSGLSTVGCEIVTTPNAQATVIHLHNKKFTKLFWWKEMSPDEEGGSYILLGRSAYERTAQFSGNYQLVSEHRGAQATVTGLTGL